MLKKMPENRQLYSCDCGKIYKQQSYYVNIRKKCSRKKYSNKRYKNNMIQMIFLNCDFTK